MNKRLFFAAAIPLVLAVFFLVSCDKATPDPRYNYRVTGNFAGWGSNYDQQYTMTNVAKSDSRLKAIKGALKDAQYVYIYEYEPGKVGAAGWTVDYPGANISLDGKYAVKFIRLAPDSGDPSGWAHDMWVPSAEAGGIKNLSPDTLFTPKARSDEERNAAGDGLGSNNDNPVLLKGDQSYYIVFAVLKDNSRAMGAVVK